MSYSRPVESVPETAYYLTVPEAAFLCRITARALHARLSRLRKEGRLPAGLLVQEEPGAKLRVDRLILERLYPEARQLPPRQLPLPFGGEA